MKPDDVLHARLLQWLDGRLEPAERRSLEQRLATDPEARAALRTLAEEAVLLGDVERTVAAHQRHVTEPPAPFRPYRSWPWAAAALLLLGLGVAGWWLGSASPELARVTRVTGASGVFGKRGAADQPLPAGVVLRAGDMIETRACDAWVELELRDGSRLTVAGHSVLRLLQPDPGSLRLSLLRGSLWRSPTSNQVSSPLVVETPASRVEAGDAQFDLQTTQLETILRVNQGRASVRHRLQTGTVEVSGGTQAEVALGSPAPPVPRPQPLPVSDWMCDFGEGTSVLLGRRLAPGDGGLPRMAAEPLLWPLPGRPPVMLHAVSVSVLQTLDRPVELGPGTRVRFQGRTQAAKPVRFGFTTQRMRGVFAGKFEVDVAADDLGVPGQPWTVDLPVGAFRPLHPELSPAPEGLELSDIYALTIRDDAGLELNRIEIVRP